MAPTKRRLTIQRSHLGKKTADNTLISKSSPMWKVPPSIYRHDLHKKSVNIPSQIFHMQSSPPSSTICEICKLLHLIKVKEILKGTTVWSRSSNRHGENKRPKWLSWYYHDLFVYHCRIKALKSFATKHHIFEASFKKYIHFFGVIYTTWSPDRWLASHSH